MLLHEWSAFHSYDFAPYGMHSFSMHFPGKLKVYRVAKTWVYMQTLDADAFATDGEEAKLTEYAASLLLDYLTNYSEPATRLGFKPHPEDKVEVEQVSGEQHVCLFYPCPSSHHMLYYSACAPPPPPAMAPTRSATTSTSMPIQNCTWYLIR